MRHGQAPARGVGHPGRYRSDQFGAPSRDPEKSRRASGPVRESGQGGHRALVRQFVHDLANDLPGAAHRQHRYRAEQYRGDDADRRSAEAIAAARRRIADPTEGTAADQRPTRAESAAARRAKRRSRTQEPGNRAGPARARGEGHRAFADLEIQVRVPRQHVARAAHAAQQHPDPRSAAHRKPGRQSVRQSRSNSPAPSTAPAPICST